MRAVVTGGAGYLGRSLLGRLLENHDIQEIHVIDNFSESRGFLSDETLAGSSVIRLHDLDVLDRRGLARLFHEGDFVFHLAGLTPAGQMNIHEAATRYEHINHWGTAQVVDAALEARPANLIYSSSTAVYGYKGRHVSRLDLPQPSDAYGISKMRAEQALSRLRGKLGLKIVRLGSLIGWNPVTRFDSFGNHFVRDYRLGHSTSLASRGSGLLPFISVEDASALLVRAAMDVDYFEVSNGVAQNWSPLEVYEALQSLRSDARLTYSSIFEEEPSLVVQETLIDVASKPEYMAGVMDGLLNPGRERHMV